MKTREQFIGEVEARGASWSEPEPGSITVHAPLGEVWTAELAHDLEERHGAERLPPEEAYESLVERMRRGTEPCDERDCPICSERQETQ